MHKSDLTRFVKWPKYVQMQRQKRILLTRLKVPPQIAQFSNTLDKDQAKKLFELLNKYKPETKKDKTERLKKEAAQKVEKGAKAESGPKPIDIKFGLGHVTTLIENKEAKLVVIAHDVDPIELVIHLPTLCKKMGIPYCFVKGKARLGTFVHQKTATCLALTQVKPADQKDLDTLANNFKSLYNENSQLRKAYGGGVLGLKNRQMMAKRAA